MSAASVDEVIELYEQFGGDPYDEDVAQLAHALQSAALAVAAGADDALVAAALLHDVGHLLHLRDRGAPGGDDLHHEERGAAWLRPLMPPSVTAPIALHVRAKRYLCAVDSTYLDQLSPGSVRSLALQGGPMTDGEVAAFETMTGFHDAVQVRRWDDAAKVIGADPAGLDHYRQVLEQARQR